MKTLASRLTHTFRKWNVPILAIAVVLVMAVWCSNALAQSGAGSIQGTVTDATGAVIPGASIQVVERGTNGTSGTKSNGVGFYQVPNLFTGTYDVTVTAPGEKTYKTTVELLVAQAAVINPSMTVGAVTQQVVVAGNEMQLTTTDNGTIASTLENARLNQLPMNGRVLMNLAGETTPGLETNGTRSGGLMGEALEYVADGAPLINRQFGGASAGGTTQAQVPDPDAVEEVRMETTNTSAQYASPGTAIITTKSGSNGLHGSLFETARNNAIGIAKGRQNPSNYIAPHLVRNEFGVSAGGPIILPHIYDGKNKSFWFFAYERYSLAQASNELAYVPTMAMRGGDFSGLIDSSGVSQQLYNPATTQSAANNYARSVFANNQIPIGLLAPATKMLYAITPMPTSSDNPLIASNITAINPSFTTIPTISIRLDHAFNENNKVYLRYGDNFQRTESLRNYPSNSPQTIAADGFPAGASGLQLGPVTTLNGALGYTHVFSPTFFAETIVSQQWFKQRTEGGGNPNLNYSQMLGLPNNFGKVGFPNIGANLIMPFGGTEFGYGINQIISNIDENLSKTLGRHQLQFGGRYRHERFGLLGNEQSDVVTFGALATALEDPASGANYTAAANTGYADADFFLGAAASYSVSLEEPFYHYRDMEFDAYFQDNFHVNKSLTLNLGLRYEAHPAYYTKDGLIVGFDLKNDAMVLPNPTSYYVSKGYTTQAIITNLENIGVVFETPSEAKYPSTILRNDNLNFFPRIGVAYQPFGGKYGTVLRGAYGRYTFPAPVGSSIKNSYADAPFVESYSQSYTAANQSPDGLPNYLLRAPQSVVMGTNSSGVVNSSTVNAILPGFSISTDDPDYPQALATEVNFTIEQTLKGNSALRLSYVWTHGANLDEYYDYNNHPSTYVWEMNKGIALPTGSLASVATGPYDNKTYGGGMVWDQKSGWSNDNALQATYQRLFHRGIAYQINYVWSKPFRVGGNTYRDGQIYPYDDFVGSSGAQGSMSSPYGTVIPGFQPPAPPAGAASYAYYKSLNVFQNYKIDTAIPKQHITFNGIVDLPFGRGRRFLGNSNHFMDEVVGGWQIAGDGNIVSQDFAITATNWGPTNRLRIYKHGVKITDCRSGVCHKSFEWFNGYIAPTANANVDCTAKCVYGLPSNWAPYQTPVDNTPGTANYGSNNVQITAPNLNGGVPVTVGYSPGPAGNNPFARTILNGPINYTIDLSVFKVFPITEKMSLRFNIDAFNALNVQGYNNPNSTDGTEAVEPNGASSSYNTPRQVQLTLRLTY